MAEKALANVAKATKSPLGDVPIGTVLPFAGHIDDEWLDEQGWMFCDGRELDKDKYKDLFDVLGNNFGFKNGKFRLPDCRGRFFRGVDHGTGRDQDSSTRKESNVGGLEGDNVGSIQDDEMRKHSHGINQNIGTWHRSFKGEDTSEKPVCTKYDAHGIVILDHGGKETRPINIYFNYIIKYRHR